MSDSDFSEEDYEHVNEMFHALADENGFITAAQFIGSMIHFFEPEALNEMIRDSGADEKGLDYAQYCKETEVDEIQFEEEVVDFMSDPTKKPVDSHFDMFSVLGIKNGFISAAELINAMTNITEKKLNEMIWEAGADVNGNINNGQYCKIISAIMKRRKRKNKTFSKDEMEHIIKGVKEVKEDENHKWAKIKDMYFKESSRTSKNLCDDWRNLLKATKKPQIFPLITDFYWS